MENKRNGDSRPNRFEPGKVSLEDITIRTEFLPGDAGYITYMHAKIYQKEYGFEPIFEAYVADSFIEFIKGYNPERDRLWCAEHNGRIVGSIAILGKGDRAKLRWFLTDPDYRGIGLGRFLLNSAISFAREKNYSAIFLDTTTGLDRALDMYEKAGFRLVSENPEVNWKEGIKELEFEMKL